jgi:ribosomal protein L7/L12
MKCPNCDREIDNDSVYCTYCGVCVETLIEEDKSVTNIDDYLKNLLIKRKLLEAVKYCTIKYGMGLKEAKDYVDSISPNFNNGI